MIDEDEDDLSATIAAALEEQEDTGIIDELVSLSDDAPDSPDFEGDGTLGVAGDPRASQLLDLLPLIRR